MPSTSPHIPLTDAGRYALRSLDLGEADCDPIHAAACALVGVDPADPEVGVVHVEGWRDCPELDALGDAAQVWVVIDSAGATQGRVVWLVPA